MTWGATRRNTTRDLNSKFERLPSDSIYEITACHSSFTTNNADGNVLVTSHKLKRDMAEGHRNLLLGTVAQEAGLCKTVGFPTPSSMAYRWCILELLCIARTVPTRFLGAADDRRTCSAALRRLPLFTTAGQQVDCLLHYAPEHHLGHSNNKTELAYAERDTRPCAVLIIFYHTSSHACTTQALGAPRPSTVANKRHTGAQCWLMML
jgi:hypothetical protein